MQDNDGNTALHLAVKAMHFGMVCGLVGTREVNLNLTNAEGETPLDTAEYMIPLVWFGCKVGIYYAIYAVESFYILGVGESFLYNHNLF